MGKKERAAARARGKGKGKGNKRGGAKKAGNKPSSRGGAPSSPSDPAALIKGKVPDVTTRARTSGGTGGGDRRPTLYARYKAATRRFLDYMRARAPADVVGTDDGRGDIKFLLSAADWMSDADCAVDAAVLRDLKLCIRMRKRVADSVFGGGDAGHRYFLEVRPYELYSYYAFCLSTPK